MELSELQLLVQHIYLMALHDVECDVEQSCSEGSLERAKELIDECMGDSGASFNIFNALSKEARFER